MKEVAHFYKEISLLEEVWPYVFSSTSQKRKGELARIGRQERKSSIFIHQGKGSIMGIRYRKEGAKRRVRRDFSWKMNLGLSTWHG